jgi:DNA-binding NarL/FixJ family response regulator
MVWHGLRAEAEASRQAAADSDSVQVLRQMLERIVRGDMAGPVRDTVAGYAQLCNGEITRIDSAPDPAVWAGAVALWEAQHHPYPAAYAQLRQADALLTKNRRSVAAKAVLKDAYLGAQALRAQPLMKEIRELAKYGRVDLDERVPGTATPKQQASGDSAKANLGRLTDREREVLSLVAQGLTNQEVADRLHISIKTVGVHVSHILDKLQAKNRAQASAIFARDK